MIKHVRQFIARIVDTRVSEAVIDLHRSMQHLEINNDERHKVILNCLDKLRLSVKDGLANNRDLIIAAVKDNYPTTAKPPVPPAPGTKKPFVGRELKNENLKSSKEWEALSEPARAHFVAMVKDRFKDIEMQGYYEAECFRQYLPVTVLLSDMLRRAANYTEAECL